MLSLKKILQTGFRGLLIRGLSVAVSFALAWVLVKVLGADDYGMYTYAFSWFYFFGSLSPAGLSRVLVRETGPYIKVGKQSFAAGLIRFSHRANFLISLILSLLFIGFVYFFVSPEKQALQTALFIAGAGIPVYGQLFISKSLLNAVKKIELSLIPEQIVRAALSLVLLGAFFYVGSKEIRLHTAIWINVAAFTGALVLSFFFVVRNVGHLLRTKPAYETRKWVRPASAFFLLSLISIINTRGDILILGLFGFTESTGIYNIAAKLANVIAIPMMLSNLILAPYISEFFKDDKRELIRIIKKIIRIIFAGGSLVMLIFIFWGNDILKLFDNEFIAGYYVLLILGSGQLLNIFVGPVGNILSMTQLEKLTLRGTAGSALINLALNLSLIPYFGMNGAAAATFTSLIFWNIYLFILTWKRLKINASVI